MKILKIFGIVVGIHLFALVLIFANPGCSSTSKSGLSPGDTASKATAAPIVPAATPTPASSTTPAEPASSAISFNPNVPAAPAPASSTGDRFVPTRPNTPVAGALLSEPTADVTPATSYAVKSGDNLWTIARKHNITVAQLTAANSLSSNASLRPGQKLVIPGKHPSAMSAVPLTATTSATIKGADPLGGATSRSSSDGLKHVVKSGETLGAIARKYDVRQGELAVANNISDPAKIRPGMELVIPGYQSTKSGKAAKSGNGKASAPAAVPSAAPVSEPFSPPPASAAPPPVPVIRIDDAPAPKQP